LRQQSIAKDFQFVVSGQPATHHLLLRRMSAVRLVWPGFFSRVFPRALCTPKISACRQMSSIPLSPAPPSLRIALLQLPVTPQKDENLRVAGK
jgi:hypothetical protein